MTEIGQIKAGETVRYAGHFAELKTKPQKLGSCDGLRRSVALGTTFKQTGPVTPCMGT
jgi:hypothetical protein